jgi:hypothetical protein
MNSAAAPFIVGSGNQRKNPFRQKTKKTMPRRTRATMTALDLVVKKMKRLIIDAVFGAIFYRLLFRSSPLTEEFSDKLVRQVFRGARARAGEATTRSKPRRVKPA